MTALVPPAQLAEPVSPERDGPTGRARRNRLSWLRRWVSPAVILLTWQALSSAGILSEQKIASPAQIATRAAELTAEGRWAPPPSRPCSAC